MVKNIGIIGYFDKGNGHPFSYSAIINGYNKEKFKKLNFQVILDYLNKRKKNEFGIKGLEITNVWTQDIKISKNLAKACYIKKVDKNYLDMIGLIDGLIIARDNMHYKIAKPFLENKIPVFIDKPLTTRKEELNYFLPYIKSGLLMSTSCFRYSNEIKIIKKKINLNGVKNLKFISANIVNDLGKYGIHMLEALDELNLLNIKKIFRLPLNFESYILINDKNIPIQLNCFGKSAKVLNMQFFFKKGKNISCDFNNNFSSFKNTLKIFAKMINEKKMQLDAKKTKNIIEIIMNARKINEKKI